MGLPCAWLLLLLVVKLVRKQDGCVLLSRHGENQWKHHGINWDETCFLGHEAFAGLVLHFDDVPGLDESGLDASQQHMEPSLSYLPAGALAKSQCVAVARLGPCGKLAPSGHHGTTAVALGELSHGCHLLGICRPGLHQCGSEWKQVWFLKNHELSGQHLLEKMLLV